MAKVKPTSKNKKKTPSGSFAKGLLILISIVTFLVGFATLVLKIYSSTSPDAAFRVNYYQLEAKDWLLEKIGLAPHYDNLNLGAPEGGSVDRIINRKGYALGYSEKYEQPLWVTYKLTSDELPLKRLPRTDDFREDPRILTRSALPEDYAQSGYDRGHLAPAADMGWDRTAMSESFYMSNMSPQKPQLNRGIWKDLESSTRDIAKREREVFIVVGPLFDPAKQPRTIGPNRVAVPQAYYKVLYDLTPPRKMIGFIIPNEGSNKKLRVYAVPVTKVEWFSGLKFFPKMNPVEAEQLKSMNNPEAWGF